MKSYLLSKEDAHNIKLAVRTMIASSHSSASQAAVTVTALMNLIINQPEMVPMAWMNRDGDLFTVSQHEKFGSGNIPLYDLIYKD